MSVHEASLKCCSKVVLQQQSHFCKHNIELLGQIAYISKFKGARVQCWVGIDTYPSGFNLLSVLTQHLANDIFHDDPTQKSPFQVLHL